jgi:hypothetical protein
MTRSALQSKLAIDPRVSHGHGESIKELAAQSDHRSAQLLARVLDASADALEVAAFNSSI